MEWTPPQVIVFFQKLGFEKAELIKQHNIVGSRLFEEPVDDLLRILQFHPSEYHKVTSSLATLKTILLQGTTGQPLDTSKQAKPQISQPNVTRAPHTEGGASGAMVTGTGTNSDAGADHLALGNKRKTMASSVPASTAETSTVRVQTHAAGASMSSHQHHSAAAPGYAGRQMESGMTQATSHHPASQDGTTHTEGFTTEMAPTHVIDTTNLTTYAGSPNASPTSTLNLGGVTSNSGSKGQHSTNILLLSLYPRALLDAVATLIEWNTGANNEAAATQEAPFRAYAVTISIQSSTAPVNSDKSKSKSTPSTVSMVYLRCSCTPVPAHDSSCTGGDGSDLQALLPPASPMCRHILFLLVRVFGNNTPSVSKLLTTVFPFQTAMVLLKNPPPFYYPSLRFFFPFLTPPTDYTVNYCAFCMLPLSSQLSACNICNTIVHVSCCRALAYAGSGSPCCPRCAAVSLEYRAICQQQQQQQYLMQQASQQTVVQGSNVTDTTPSQQSSLHVPSQSSDGTTITQA